MIIELGEKVMIAVWFGYGHLAGEVNAASEVAIRVIGYVFAFNPKTRRYVRRRKPTTFIFSFTDQRSVIQVLPLATDVAKLVVDRTKGLHLADGKNPRLDPGELVPSEDAPSAKGTG